MVLVDVAVSSSCTSREPHRIDESGLEQVSLGPADAGRCLPCVAVFIHALKQ